MAATLLRPDAVVHLDVPAESAHERSLTRGEGHESRDYLCTARATYLEFTRPRGWSVVDATGTTEMTVAQIVAAADH